ncbi:MAG: hypothetical protein M3308_00860 [Actinomycetota bacterium]|nr:hypothetical protein [Actinomycetota bacterium]
MISEVIRVATEFVQPKVRAETTAAGMLAAYMRALLDIWISHRGSPGYPADTEWLRKVSRQCYTRSGYDAAAVRRQSAAIPAAGDRRPGPMPRSLS